jgi:hypothetical protein
MSPEDLQIASKKTRFKALGNTYADSNYCEFVSSLGRYVFGSEISYNKPPPRLPGLGC